MTIRQIMEMPTVVTEVPCGCSGVHESVLRAYNILERVKEWLSSRVPADVILDLIDELEEKRP